MRNCMRPIKEVKYNNLRRLFYEHDSTHPITYKAFAETLEERADVMGKYLSGRFEIPDVKILKWCSITSLPFSFFYDEHDAVPWPPQKKSYRMMAVHDVWLLPLRITWNIKLERGDGTRLLLFCNWYARNCYMLCPRRKSRRGPSSGYLLTISKPFSRGGRYRGCRPSAARRRGKHRNDWR